MKIPPTITAAECAEVLRANCIKTGQESFRLGVEQGVFDFANIITGCTHPVYLIWTKLLDDWLAEHVGSDYISCETVLTPIEEYLQERKNAQ